MKCGEGFYEGDQLVARCTREHGTEHSHSDRTTGEMIASEEAEWLGDGMHPATIEIYHGEVVGIYFAEVSR